MANMAEIAIAVESALSSAGAKARKEQELSEVAARSKEVLSAMEARSTKFAPTPGHAAWMKAHPIRQPRKKRSMRIGKAAGLAGIFLIVLAMLLICLF